MTAAEAVPAPSEWREGWKIVLGCSLGSATGVILLFFTFSLFVLPIMAELGLSRGEMGVIQSLIIAGALGAPLLGRLTDLWGFKPVFALSAMLVVAIELTLALFGRSGLHLALGVALLGFVGVGTTALTVTRPVNAHFDRFRGRALGLVVVGVSITTMLVPLLLQGVMEAYGWRGAMIALAAIAGGIGLPAVLLLVPPEHKAAVDPAIPRARTDWSFLRTRDFWLMTGANMIAGVATAGFVGQLSPIVQEEGLSAAVGALALSVFAVGQFVGRLGGGWLLDRYDPRRVAVLLILIPSSGFLFLIGSSGMALVVLLAAGLIGLQQGGELDVFAYFTARRFGMARYGTVYGALNGFGWIGNAAGVAGVGLLHDRFGSYLPAQIAATVALVIAAALVSQFRLPPDAAVEPKATEA